MIPPARQLPAEADAQARNVGRLIKHALASLLRSIDERMQPLGLTAMQWEPIALIHFHKVDTVAALAREMQVNCASMTRMLDRLEAKELLQRRRSDTDRRVVHLELSAQGKKVALEIRPLALRSLDEHLKGFKPAEVATLTQFLERNGGEWERYLWTRHQQLMTNRMYIRARIVFSIAIAAAVIAGCGTKQQAAAPQMPEVAVITLAPRSVSITDTLPGRTTAFRVAEVRPQVSGIVQKRLFTEGGEVKAGQQLLQIDPATYRVAASAAEAALKRAEARLVTAKLLEERYKPLIAANAVSQQDYDNSTADHAQAEADVASARAQIESARINVIYTQVLAAISGRIGRAFVTEGALVTAGQAQPLALVQQLDPIYVDISQSSAQMLRLQRQLNDGQLQKDDANQAEVILTLEDGREYPEHGKLQFSEVSVDPGTGAVVLRAMFPNPRRELLPGMFVRAQLAQGQQRAALLVPQRGVTRNQRGEATAMVVGADNKVQERVIGVDRVIDNAWLVNRGLAAGDRVIVDGLQKIRAGQEVKAVEAAETPQAATAPVAQR